jgi:D-alanyl-lipoteichoic acid acyltransferase DltB (MBOAT superfamily)
MNVELFFFMVAAVAVVPISVTVALPPTAGPSASLRYDGIKTKGQTLDLKKMQAVGLFLRIFFLLQSFSGQGLQLSSRACA